VTATGVRAGAEPAVDAPVLAVRRRWATPALLLGCAALAAVSLRVPAIVGYDPWVWLIWGREVTRGTLSSDGTIAWKPLPVLVTAVLVPAGGAAPDLWLLVSRAVGLSGLVAVFGLAAHLVGRGAGRLAALVAGAVETVTFLLTPDNEARWLRHLLQGNIEPVTVALCLWAVRRHLDGRPGQAVLLGALAGLTRPEAWPFLALYAGWLLWRAPRRWWVLVPGLAVVPLLWFGGDRLASGDALAGAATAQVLVGTGMQRLLVALDAALAMVVVPVWVAAAVAVVWAAHRRQATPAVLAVAGLAWAGLVAAMAAVFGYAALGRFYAPAAAVLCVLAGVAAGWAVAWPAERTAHRMERTPRSLTLQATRAAGPAVVLAAVVAAAAPFAAPRVAWLPAQVEAAAGRAAAEADVVAMVVAAGGRAGLLACGPLSVDATRPAGEVRPRLAWLLDLPLSGVRNSLDNGPGITVMRAGTLLDHTLAARPPEVARPVVRTRDWVAYAEYCPAGRPLR
jgi:hypothetical protein